MQKLLMPMNNCKITAGYKSQAYKNSWGFHHYGMDLIDTKGDRRIFALGKGDVVACGMDGSHEKDRLGNTVVIVYRDVVLNKSGKTVNLACRMFHLEKITVKVGQTVNVGDVIGLYGNTGAYTSGAHLHIEFDTDINYPQYAYGIGRSGNVIKKGSIDSTKNPADVFWLSDNQNFFFNEEDINTGWVKREDTVYPTIKKEDTVADILKKFESDIEIMQKENKSYFERILNKLNSIDNK